MGRKETIEIKYTASINQPSAILAAMPLRGQQGAFEGTGGGEEMAVKDHPLLILVLIEIFFFFKG